ncbi:DNA-binding transcriptional regulator YdaS (Cro superfamily) [Oxalobacteraceae bacterium GrIS 1.11]
MTPIGKAIAQLGGQTAVARVLGLSGYQVVQQWIAQARVPAEYCPRMEQLTAGAVRCEELNDRVEWSLIRGANPSSTAAAIAQTRHVYEGDKSTEGALDYLEAVLQAGHLSAADLPQARMDAGAKPATSSAQVPARACTAGSATPGAPINITNITNITDLSIGIGTTSIAQALAQVEQLKLAAEGTVAVLTVIGDALESAAADDTLQLVLEELRGLRAELVAGRKTSAVVPA